MTCSARVRAFRRLQTSVRYYVHPDTGRRITLIGSVPAGRPTYYTALHTVITECQASGAVVFCAADPLARPIPAHSTARERLAVQELARKHNVVTRHLATRGWVTQATALTDGSWHVRDLPAVDLIRRIGVELVIAELRDAARLLNRVSDDDAGRHLFNAITATELGGVHPDRSDREKVIRSPLDAVVGERNTVVLEALHGTTSDVALLWDVAYLPGFAAYLDSLGFRLDRERWLPVGRLPRLTYAGASALVQARLDAKKVKRSATSQVQQ